MKKLVFSILKRFLVLNIITWLIIGVSIPLISNPIPKYVYSDSDWENFHFLPQYNHSQWNILFDGHSHTFYSDGYLSPRQNILWHIAMGFNAMVLTDHNTFEGVEEIRKIAREEFDNQIKILAGMEWTTDRLHMNIILPPNISVEEYKTLVSFKSYSYTPSNEEIQEIISKTHSLGGIISLNHYIWSQSYCKNHPTRQELKDWGIDYIEVVNENVFDNDSYYFCQENGLGMITGTDMHQPGSVYSWTTLNVSEFTEKEIFRELKNKRTGFIYDGVPSPYTISHPINPRYLAVLPLIKVGELFESMYSSGMLGTQLAILFGYIYGVFIITELSSIVLKKLYSMLKEKKEAGKNSN
ncbi:MAG: PHP domain-containing protein [Candidatus Heimdallarchaeaceae archaeon]